MSEEENLEVVGQPQQNTRRKEDRQLGQMMPETRRLLEDFHRPYNVRLADLLDDQRFLWDG